MLSTAMFIDLFKRFLAFRTLLNPFTCSRLFLRISQTWIAPAVRLFVSRSFQSKVSIANIT